MNNETVRRACHAIGMDNKITLFRADWGMNTLTNWNLKDLQKQTVESSQLPII